MLELSQRASTLKTSPTLFLVARAKELQSLGYDVLSLTVGEPDWETYSVVKEAGIEAIKTGYTKYTPASGAVDVREAIAQKIKEEIDVAYSSKEITIASGAKYIIYTALQVLCSPGDEVIVTAPYWVSYPTMIELAGGVPVVVSTEASEGFKITPQKLEAAITPQTKAFLFCSPSNPTGLLYSEQELSALAEVFRKHPHIAILTDDIYNRLVFTGAKVAPHILSVAPDLKARVIIINGGSKAYSMTGWRIGWAAGPQRIITAMADYQSQSTGSPSSIAQFALKTALEQCEGDLAETVSRLLRRRDIGLNHLRSVPEFQTQVPQGAFYFWVHIASLFGRTYKDQIIKNSKDFCDILLNEFFVATVPGIECGSEGYMRLSFAVSEETMEKAVIRMKEMIALLK